MKLSTRKRQLRFATVLAVAMAVSGCAPSSPEDRSLLRPPSAASTTDIARLEEAARAHANFSVAQHEALQRELVAQRRRRAAKSGLNLLAQSAWRSMRRGVAASTNPAAPTPASFLGNLTVVGGRQALVVLQRQADCSLTLATGTYSFASPANLQINQLTPHYDQTLHAQAGLTTTGGVFAASCAGAGSGLGSSEGTYLGETSNGLALFAGTGVASMSSSNGLFATPVNLAATTIQTAGSYFVDTAADYSVLAAGDLNGDGLADAVAIDFGSSSIHIFLASPSGTLSAPVTVTLPGAGNLAESLVIADLNGDGKQDVAVATIDTTASPQQEYLTLLIGNGNGTFGAPQTQPIATPSATIQNLIAANFRSATKLDLLGSNGQLLLNDGAGHFAAAATPAFAPSPGQSAYSPNLVAADFDKDGKLDVAIDTGAEIKVYKGSGTGIFTQVSSYSSIDSEGYLAAGDLDGDGNIDLWVGIARAGVFGGDQSNTQGYALLGNGDGTFQGSATLPFVYAGANVADLDGDGFPDAVGVNDDLSLTSYLGNGSGHFTAHSTVSEPTSYMGHPDTITNVDSIALADVDGDGKPELLYIPSGGLWFNGENGTAGLFIAINDGHGGFAPPVFYAVASSLPAGHSDRYWSIANLHVADLNQDGKADLIYNYIDTDTVTNMTTYGSAVQLGNGDGTFGASLAIPYNTVPYGTFTGLKQAYVVAVADLNHDGKPDVVIEAGTGSNDTDLSAPVMQLQTALGNGDGTFAAANAVTGPDILVRSNFSTSVPQSLFVADMNGDGVPDLVVQGSSLAYKAQIAVALGNGNGTFKAPSLLTYDAQYLNVEQGIAIGDFNGDGKPDVFVDSPFDGRFNGIFAGNGDGTLQSATNTQSQTVPTLAIYLQESGAAVALDVHHDGHLAILAGNSLLIPQANVVTVPAKAASSTALAASATTLDIGQTVTLTATVSGTGGTPTGTVSFTDGASPLGSSAVSAQGVASLAVSSLVAGAHSITATYGGDANFAVSTSTAVAVTVNGGSFALASSPASGSISAGGSATTTVTATPSGNFMGTVSLSCSGLPTGAACVFSPASVALNGAAVTSSLTISTGARMAQLNMVSPFSPLEPTPVLAVIILVPVLRSTRHPRRRMIRGMRWMGAGFLCMLALASCRGDHSVNPDGGSGGTPAGTYTITVTGTAGSATQTTTYSLTVS